MVGVVVAVVAVGVVRVSVIIVVVGAVTVAGGGFILLVAVGFGAVARLFRRKKRGHIFSLSHCLCAN